MQRSDYISITAIIISIASFLLQWWRGRQHIIVELHLTTKMQTKRIEGRQVFDKKKPIGIYGYATVYNRTRSTVSISSSWKISKINAFSYSNKNPNWNIPAGERKELEISYSPDWNLLASSGSSSSSKVTWKVTATSQSCFFCRISRKVHEVLAADTIMENIEKISQ